MPWGNWCTQLCISTKCYLSHIQNETTCKCRILVLVLIAICRRKKHNQNLTSFSSSLKIYVYAFECSHRSCKCQMDVRNTFCSTVPTQLSSNSSRGKYRDKSANSRGSPPSQIHLSEEMVPSFKIQIVRIIFMILTSRRSALNALEELSFIGLFFDLLRDAGPEVQTKRLLNVLFPQFNCPALVDQIAKISLCKWIPHKSIVSRRKNPCISATTEDTKALFKTQYAG